MEPVDFVRALSKSCRDSAVSGCTKILESPPGRNPDPSLSQLSEWFNSLSDSDRENVIRIMDLAADSTLFGVLCVLDGVRPVESTTEKSEFILSSVRAGITSTISPSKEQLHDIYRSAP
jgi:hypothetical protein